VRQLLVRIIDDQGLFHWRERGLLSSILDFVEQNVDRSFEIKYKLNLKYIRPTFETTETSAERSSIGLTANQDLHKDRPQMSRKLPECTSSCFLRNVIQVCQ